MDSYIHLPSIQSFLDALVITRCPEILYCFKNPLSLLPCSSLPHEYTPPSDNSSHSPRIRSSSVVRVIHKILRNTMWSSENPLQPIALDSPCLLALRLVPYVEQYPLKFFVVVLLFLWIQRVSEYWQSPINPWKFSFRLRHRSGYELVLAQSRFDGCTSKSIQLNHLLIRASASDPSSWNHNSFVLKHRIIQMFL